jgi:protein-tyrosine phosphatase
VAFFRTADDAPLRVLFVCTGNICRSAIAERVTRAYLDTALGADAAWIRLESAGTQAVVDSGVHPYSATVLAGLGGDPDGFAARQLTEHTAVSADLTLALTRAHRHSVLKMSPRGLSRTFTLLEAADLARLVPYDVVLQGDTFAERFRSLIREMAVARAHRASDGGDDIPDPIREPLGFHEEVGDVIAEAVRRLFGRIVDLGPASRALPARREERSVVLPLTRR